MQIDTIGNISKNSNIMRNNSRLHDIISKLQHTIEISGLDNINPIFVSFPTYDIEEDGTINLCYPNKEYGQLDIKYKGPIKTDSFNWSLLIGEGIIIKQKAIKMVWTDSNSITPSETQILRPIDSNIYIKTFYEVFSKYKNTIVTITDGLPYLFVIRIRFGFNYKKLKKENLKTIASLVLQNIDKKEEVEKIIASRTPFKQAIDDILRISGKETDTQFSYCLACGDRIPLGKKFCDSSKKGYQGRDNCYLKFKHWVNDRLEITHKEELAAFITKLSKELKETIQLYPLYAFESLKSKYPKLYTRKNSRKTS